MAYADEKTRPNRASIGGTLLVNGLMVTGIILAVPDVSPIKIHRHGRDGRPQRLHPPNPREAG